MRVLLTGSTGMLGTAIARTLSTQPGLELVGISRQKSSPFLKQITADLTQPGFLDAVEGKFDWVLHTAANVSVDGCETDRVGAKRLHVDSTAALVARFPEARFVYISTDAVFDGRHPPYSETSGTNPLNYYAMTKLAGEAAAAKARHHHILRMSIVGFHLPELRNSLAEWGLKSWREGKTTPGFTDISFNPLYVGTVAELLRETIAGKTPLPEGVLHLGSADPDSKFHFLRQLALALGHSPDLVQPSLYAQMNAQFQATRPSNIQLNTAKARAAGLPVPTMAEEIGKLAADLKSNKIPTHGI